MRTNLFILVSILSLSSLFAQEKVVCLNRNGNSTMFYGDSAFVFAYNQAQQGDTIYLPGGIIIYPQIINKRLVIYGTGHYPDSTTATGRTTINGSLTIGENADKLHLEGLLINGSVNYESYKKIDSTKIFRCRITGGINGTGATGANEGVSNTIVQSVIDGSISLSGFKNSFILNSVFSTISYAKNSVISNNIITYDWYNSYIFSYTNDCQITNNIILGPSSSYMLGYSSQNTIANNVFVISSWTDPNNNFIGNYYNISMSSLFVNYTSSAFSYVNNYHLQNPSMYVGNDGSQVGLYGGYFPYKDGALPTNPHIRFKQISSNSSSTGKIKVHIKAAAQNE